MKFKLIFFIFFLFSCTSNITKLENRVPFNSKGFAYIYNDKDYQNKIINGKLDNSKLQIAHSELKPNIFLKISNPKTNDYLILKNQKKIDYPDFYKILITTEVASKLNIENDLPLIEILEIKKNKSFIAEKAKIYNEEKKILSNAPVTSVQISNISKNKKLNKSSGKQDFYILIGTFYREETVNFLKKRITKEIPKYESKKMKVRKKNNQEINLLSGPYNTINLMKNDYILLKSFGFEELDIITNE